MFRKLLIASLIVLGACSASVRAQSDAVTFSVSDGPFTLFRQVARGWERQVVLRVVNGGGAFEPGSARVTIGSATVERPLEPIPSGESHDVIWVPGSDKAATVDFETNGPDSQTVRCRLQLPPVTPDQVVAIASSPVVKAIPPLAIRGTNYMPKEHPWPGIAREGSVLDFEEDFALMRRLGINTLRTFVFFDPDTPESTLGLYYKDGCATTRAQKRLNDILTVADRYRIKVVLLIPSEPSHGVAVGRRCAKSLLSPFVNDGRLLMVDLANELDAREGEEWVKAGAWMQAMLPYVRSLVPNHLITVALTWRFDKLIALGVTPDIYQYHDYSGAVGKPVPGKPDVRNVSDDLARDKKLIGGKPLLIGEFGQSTNAEAGGVTEARHAEIYRGVFEGAEAQKIVGVMNWQLYDLVPDWMGAKERVYGCVRTDGTLKPSGELLKKAYTRWARQYPAPWDAR